MKAWRKHVHEKFHPVKKEDPAELARELNLLIRMVYAEPSARVKAAQRLAARLPKEVHSVLLGKTAELAGGRDPKNPS